MSIINNTTEVIKVIKIGVVVYGRSFPILFPYFIYWFPILFPYFIYCLCVCCSFYAAHSPVFVIFSEPLFSTTSSMIGMTNCESCIALQYNVNLLFTLYLPIIFSFWTPCWPNLPSLGRVPFKLAVCLTIKMQRKRGETPYWCTTRRFPAVAEFPNGKPSGCIDFMNYVSTTASMAIAWSRKSTPWIHLWGYGSRSKGPSTRTSCLATPAAWRQKESSFWTASDFPGTPFLRTGMLGLRSFKTITASMATAWCPR